jgi:hypothetical protein
MPVCVNMKGIGIGKEYMGTSAYRDWMIIALSIIFSNRRDGSRVLDSDGRRRILPCRIVRRGCNKRC